MAPEPEKWIVERLDAARRRNPRVDDAVQTKILALIADKLTERLLSAGELSAIARDLLASLEREEPFAD